MSESEMRQIVLESKEFAYAIGEQMRDRLENTDCALIAYNMLRNKRFGESQLDYELDIRNETLRVVMEIIKPIAKDVLESELEAYKDNHPQLANNRDDCSAFKDHRENHPELYE